MPLDRGFRLETFDRSCPSFDQSLYFQSTEVVGEHDINRSFRFSDQRQANKETRHPSIEIPLCPAKSFLKIQIAHQERTIAIS